jgi:hypothetical protein
MTGHRSVRIFQLRPGTASRRLIGQGFFAAAALAFGLLAVSCGKQRTGWRGTIQVANGVTVVRNPAQGIWDAEGRSGVSLLKEREIGALDGPAEVVFRQIADVAVNSKGDIYVADEQLTEIRKFDKEGKHLLTFGRKGQGPGEFQSIRVLSIDPRDDIMAFDGMVGSISVFSENGELRTTTKKLLETDWVDAAEIYRVGHDYVLFGKKGEGLSLFHKFDEDWTLKGSFIDYELVDNKEFEMTQLGFYPGNCDFRGPDDIIYAKPFYDNRILVYKDKKLARIIERESDIKKPYEVEVFHDVQKAMGLQRKYDFATFGRGVAFLGRSFQTSIGLFRLPSGGIVNFLSVRNTKESGEEAKRGGKKSIFDLTVEIYDADGRLLTYAVLGPDLGYRIRCMDESGLFYATAWQDYPKVVMFRLKGMS